MAKLFQLSCLAFCASGVEGQNALRGYSSFFQAEPKRLTPGKSTQTEFLDAHDTIFGTILGAYNSRTTASADNDGLGKIADLLEPKGVFCFPYPYCVEGQDEVREVLEKLRDHSVDTYMIPSVPNVPHHLPDARVTFNDLHGELWAPSVSYSLKSKVGTDTCLVVNPEQWTWDVSASDSTKVSQLNVYFDEKSRLDQVQACSGPYSSVSTTAQDFGLLVGTSAFLPAESQKTIRNNLQVALDGLVQGTMNPTQSDEFTDGWVEAFSDDPTDQISLCDPYPSCYNTVQKIRDFAQYSVDTYSRGMVRQIGTLMVAGNVGAVQTIYSDIPKNGDKCISSHVQWLVMQLADPATGPQGPFFQTPNNIEKMINLSQDTTIVRANPGTKKLLSHLDIFYSFEAYLHERHQCAATATPDPASSHGSMHNSNN